MNPYAPPSLTALPTSLPVFPLNVLLLPGAFLPLNIFCLLYTSDAADE